MHLDRRSFLRVAAGTAVAGFFPLRTAVALAAPNTGPLSMATFTPLVNTTFRFTVAGRSVSLVLEQVVDERRAGSAGECFSLIFVGSKPGFGQGTYAVDHPKLARFDLFVAPVGRRSDGQDYQAVFNRTTA
ncbi:MAG: DUF6916 family protein [Acidimicrobiales bacterium]